MTDLGTAILDLLANRRAGATVCPSDVARAVAGSDGAWRKLMEPVRQAGRALAADGRLVVTQRGEQVDPATARATIRYRLP